jgi:hypothetical protein
MSSYRVRRKDDQDGPREYWVWWQPRHCNGRVDRSELVEGSPFRTPLEATDGMNADRIRRAHDRETRR